MTHSDDNGLVVPPKLAPIQVAIVPIYRSAEQLAQLQEKIAPLVTELKGMGISVVFDDDDNRKPGWKFAEYEMKGVPVRLAMGPRDLENNTIEVARRDTLEKTNVSFDEVAEIVSGLMVTIQSDMLEKARKFRELNSHKADTWEEFQDIIKNKGGFVYAHWDGTAETEEQIKQKTKATIRCIPLNNELEAGKCILTGKDSRQRVIFAKAY